MSNEIRQDKEDFLMEGKPNAKAEWTTRLRALARKKNAAEKAAAEARAAELAATLDLIRESSDDTRFAQILDLFFEALTTMRSRTIAEANIDIEKLGGAIVQHFMSATEFPYSQWTVIASPDPNAADEDNLSVEGHFTRCPNCFSWKRQNDIKDLFHLFGAVARKIRSPFLPQILKLLVRFDALFDKTTPEDAEKVRRAAADFVANWRLVAKELQVMDDEERLAAAAKRPERQHIRCEPDVSDLTPEEATDISRESAIDDYAERYLKLGLMLKPGEDEKRTHPLERLRRPIVQLADEIENERPSLPAAHGFDIDFKTLGEVLSNDFRLCYTTYFDNVDDGFDEEESTRESDLKDEIVKALNRYLRSATRLAKKVGSKSADDFTTARTLLEMHKGLFQGWGEADRLAALRDLKKFMESFRQGRERLYGDFANYTPPEPTEPEKVLLEGFTPAGKTAMSQIVHKKPTEKDYFSNRNLSILFGAHVNTVSNWLTGKNPAPEGFHEAFDDKNYAKMTRCAEKYRARRGKADAMNTKHVVHRSPQ